MDGYREDYRKSPLWYKLESLRLQVLNEWEELSVTDIGFGFGIAVFFAYFFYRSIWAVVPMLAVGVFFMYRRLEKKKKRNQLAYLEQFKECIFSVVGAVKAGYAVENAFAESILDMEMLYGKDCRMVGELRILCREVRNNMPLEEALDHLGDRSGLWEVREFAEVFAISKRNSGNVTETMELYSRIITERLELVGELETLLAAKRLEQKVMNVMPFFILGYLGFTNPGYFDMMYHNLTGIGIMTGCLLVYLVAFAMSEKILEKTFG